MANLEDYTTLMLQYGCPCVEIGVVSKQKAWSVVLRYCRGGGEKKLLR